MAFFSDNNIQMNNKLRLTQTKTKRADKQHIDLHIAWMDVENVKSASSILQYYVSKVI